MVECLESDVLEHFTQHVKENSKSIVQNVIRGSSILTPTRCGCDLWKWGTLYRSEPFCLLSVHSATLCGKAKSKTGSIVKHICTDALGI